MLTPDEKRDGIRRFMNERGLSMLGWTSLANLPESTLRNFLNGNTRSMRAETEQRLAQAIGVHVDEMFGQSAPNTKTNAVWVKGYLGPGNQIEMFEAMGPDTGFYDVPAPPGQPGAPLLALEIRGGNMPPWRDGDVLYCADTKSLDLETLWGEACLCGLDTGAYWLREIRRGYEPGRVNLLAWDGAPIMESVKLTRALPLIGALRKTRKAP